MLTGRPGRGFFFCLISLAATLAVAAPKGSTSYVAAPPLIDVVSATVGAVAPGPVQVPIITWGGDIATVYGNGNN